VNVNFQRKTEAWPTAGTNIVSFPALKPNSEVTADQFYKL